MGVLTDSLWPDLCFLLFAFWTMAYIYASRHFNFWIKQGIPYIKPLPFLGNFSDIVLSRLSVAQLLKKVYEEHRQQPYVGMFAFDQPFLLVRDRRLVKHILSSKVSGAWDWGTADCDRCPLGPRNIFGASGDRWSITRNKLIPTFTVDEMKQMYHVLDEIGKDFASCFETSAFAELEDHEMVGLDCLSLLEDFSISFHIIYFTLYHLALNQELQSSVRAEVQKYNSSPTYETVFNMKQLDMIVKETLRMYPVFGFLGCKTTTDCKLPGTDVIIPADTWVAVSVWGQHMDAEFHPSSTTYNPGRFSEKNKLNIEEYTYMPFGVRQHNDTGIMLCLMLSKIALVHILSKYSIDSCEETPQILNLNSTYFLRNAANGIPLKFRKIC